MTDRTELKTWRMLLAANVSLEHSLSAAQLENLEGAVGHQIREAGMYVAGALATLEAYRDEPQPDLVASVPLALTQVDQLIAMVTGTRDRVAGVGAGALEAQLNELRDTLIEADQEIRARAGLPLD